MSEDMHTTQSAQRELTEVRTSWHRAVIDTLTFQKNARWVVSFAILLITLARSAVFIFWEQSHFDANQAVIGLMAKHLAELRALPVFMYGQNYQLAVESWLAAPVFLVAGPSVTALKLPLLAINFAVAVLLIRLLTDETRVPPITSGLSAIFFVLPPPSTAAKLLEPSGGTLQPLLYVLLLWLTRQRPVWCGLILGIGVLNREFTIYAFVALLILGDAERSWLNRHNLRRLLTVVCVAGLVWIGGQLAGRYGSAEGPGSAWADLAPGAKRVEIANRLCLDWRAVPRGYLDIARIHWPLLFGTELRPLRGFNIESDVNQGFRGAGVVLGIAMLLAVVRIGTHLLRERRWRREYRLLRLFDTRGYAFDYWICRWTLRRHFGGNGALRHAVPSRGGRSGSLVSADRECEMAQRLVGPAHRMLGGDRRTRACAIVGGVPRGCTGRREGPHHQRTGRTWHPIRDLLLCERVPDSLSVGGTDHRGFLESGQDSVVSGTSPGEPLRSRADHAVTMQRWRTGDGRTLLLPSVDRNFRRESRVASAAPAASF